MQNADARPGRVIVGIEDDPALLELMTDVLTEEGYLPVCWATPSGVVTLIDRTRPG